MLKIINTEDGSHSIINTELDETYHSIHGAIQESNHVFIQNGLQYLLNEQNPKRIYLLEMGFGTGLNALLTSLYLSKQAAIIEYTTIEAFPIPRDLVCKLNYSTILEGEENEGVFEKLHLADWEKMIPITNKLSVLKMHQELQSAILAHDKFNLVYFDAFAPSKQPEMWSLKILEKVTDSMCHGGVFVTYSAKGQLKRELKDLGFDVQTLEGPPGKMQMTRAIKR